MNRRVSKWLYGRFRQLTGSGCRGGMHSWDADFSIGDRCFCDKRLMDEELFSFFAKMVEEPHG